MDFLRRLAPGRAAEPGAAHLDERPRWLAPASTPLEAASESPAADRLPAAAQAPRHDAPNLKTENALPTKKKNTSHAAARTPRRETSATAVNPLPS